MLGLGFQGGFLCNSCMGAKTHLSRTGAVRSPVCRVEAITVEGASFVVLCYSITRQIGLQVHPPAGALGNASCFSLSSPLAAPC